MEALGEYIVNLLNNSIAKWLQDLFLGFITAVMGFVSDMIANMWNIDVIKALVNCTSGISMGVYYSLLASVKAFFLLLFQGYVKICGTVIRLIPLTVQKKDISPSPN